jgi:VanZ like protein
MQRRSGQLLATAGLLLVGGTTLIPLPRQAAAAAATPLWCLVCGDYGGADVVVNILLFIPLALGLRLLGWSPAPVVATGAAISFTVELLQLALIPGRDASLSDLLTNTVGSGLGAVLGSKLTSLVRPPREGARSLAITAGLLWLGIQAGTGFLLQPWVPSDRLLAVWGRSRPGHEPFEGKVTSTFVSGIRIANGTLIDSVVGRRLARGRIRVEVALISGRPVADWSPVFELMGSHGAVLAIEVAGRDLAFRPPSRAYQLRLRGPGLRIPAALPSSPERPVQLAAEERDHVIRASVAGAGPLQSSDQALSPSSGWSLMIPFDYAYGPEARLLTGLWIAGLLLPIGYWLAAAGETRRLQLVSLGTLLFTGLGLIPLVLGYPAVHWSEWVAGMVGTGIGWATHPAAAYFGGRCDSPSTRESC